MRTPRFALNTVFGLMASCLLASSALAAGELPNPATNPGALNGAVTPATINQTICIRGWTRTVRPPLSYTEALKRRLVARAGLPASAIRSFELDHLVPLELGGAPADRRNLWLQPWKGQWNAHVKDRLETRLKVLVCRHRLALSVAQLAIASNWITAYQKYMPRGGAQQSYHYRRRSFHWRHRRY